MIKIAFVSIILSLAAGATTACAQLASKDPFADHNGCVDFSAEYMGCFSSGAPPEVLTNVGRDRAISLGQEVEAPAGPTRFSPSTPSAASPARLSDAVALPNFESDRTLEFGPAIGHLGAP
jgi:hypothetical protein